jgi:transcriptional regulator
MHRVPLFALDDLKAQHRLMRERPLALMVTTSIDGPVIDAIPFLLDASIGAKGALHAHIARANPQCAALLAARRATIVFQDVDAYVTPSWYPSKREGGRVVPTWNYGMVQVSGAARLIDDADWLRAHVDKITQSHEATRPAPWAVDDAPDDYLASMLRQIIGVEILIDKIEAKWKVSQNKPEADRRGVAHGLLQDGGPTNERMANLVENGGPHD